MHTLTIRSHHAALLYSKSFYNVHIHSPYSVYDPTNTHTNANKYWQVEERPIEISDTIISR